MVKSRAALLLRPAAGLLRSRRVLAHIPKVHLMHVRSSSNCEMDGIVIGVYQTEGDKDPVLTGNGERFDDRVKGKISELIKEVSFSGEVGKGLMFSNLDKEYKAVAVVGLGQDGAGYNEEEDLDVGMENVRVAAAVGSRFLQYMGVKTVYVDGMEYPEQAAEGAALAVWRYDVNVRKAHRMVVPKLELYGSSDVDAWTRGLFKAESQNLARRLSDAASNQMTPAIFAQAVVDSLCPCGVNVQVRSMEWIEEQRLNSFLMITKGSCEPPIVLEISYTGTSPEDRPILFMGQGLTFNSGGLCLRRNKGVSEEKGAMSGAASIVGAIRAAAALSLPLNVSAMLPLCENMPSGMAVKAGDVVTLLNGRTLGIRDPYKAGTVMLLDPMLYAQATFKPKILVNLGTHAMGVVYGLGSAATGLWTNSNLLWEQFRKAGSVSGDRMWRMPLWNHFKRLIEPNRTYDLCNKGRGPASSCLAAALLHRNVPCCDWVFMDAQGTGLQAKEGTPPYLLQSRMTGRPTRTLIQFLNQMACS